MSMLRRSFLALALCTTVAGSLFSQPAARTIRPGSAAELFERIPHTTPSTGFSSDEGQLYAQALPAAGRPDEAFVRYEAGSPYLAERTFGRLVRTAKRLGYNLVPYEAEPPPDDIESLAESVAYREEAQANNLVRIFARDPEAKAILHVGYSHAAEPSIPSFDGTTMPLVTATENGE